MLLLPCDWRFLPKLGPLHRPVRGPFFMNNGFVSSCHWISYILAYVRFVLFHGVVVHCSNRARSTVF